MPDPTDPHATASVPADAHASVTSDRDETAAGNPSASTPAVPGFGPPAHAGEVGTLGPYRVVKELGRGGMGAVYAAVDTRLDRRVAFKVMLPQFAADVAAKERFLREAKAAARVRHVNVVTVYEADERGGVPYIAMEFLEGLPLDAYLKRKGSPSIPQIVRIATEAATGLAAAHKLGLVHRDVKPANLWLEAPNGAVKVLDFGLARPLDGEAELTQSGAVVGTPAYMSPEQARGERVDARTDLFSLGSVLYRLCTGKLPFRGPSTMAVLMSLGLDEPAPVRDLNPAVPEALSSLVHQLLAKRPEQRPQTAPEVVQRLRAVAQELAAPHPPAELSASLPYVVPPAVVYTATPVTVAPEANPFADLDAPDPERTALESGAGPGPGPAPAGGRWRRVAFGLAALAALVAGVAAAVAGRNRGGAEPGADSPGGAAPASEAGKVSPRPGGKGTPAGADRRAAEYTLAQGGFVRVTADGADRDVRSAADLPGGTFALTGVSLVGRPVTDAGLAAFRGCKELRSLNLGRSPVTDAGLTHFRECRGLESLELHETAVTDAGVAAFRDCANLTHLSLGSTRVTDAGLATFRGCTKLTGLWVGDNPGVTDAGLAALKDCVRLRELHLSGTGVTDAGLAQFGGCTDLRELYLEGTGVTDAGLAHFKDRKGLTILVLDNTTVTNASLGVLAGFSQLGVLYVRKTGLTAGGVKKLAAAVPGCRIEHDGGVVEPKVAFPPLAPAWVETVRAMKPDDQVKEVGEELKRRNPAFDGVMQADGKPVASLAFKSPHLADLTPLRALAQLEHVHFDPTADRATVKLADLRPLAGLPLRTVYIENCPRVTDLAPLRGMPLTFLHLAHTGVTSLEPVRGADLKTLDLIVTPVTDLGPIAGMKLERFHAHELAADLDYRGLRGMPVRWLAVSPPHVSADEWAVLQTLPVEKLGVGSRYDGARDGEHLRAFLRAVKTVTSFHAETLEEGRWPAARKALADVVREFPNIKTVNDKPAAEFWKEFDAKK